MNPFSKLRSLVAEMGAFETGLFVLQQGVAKVFAHRVGLIRYLIFAQPCPPQALLDPRRGRDIELKWVQAGDGETRDFPRPAAVIADRYAQGSVCLCAYKHGEFAGYLWLVPRQYREDEVRCDYYPLPEGRVWWDYDVYITPAHRIGFVFAKLWDEAYRVMREQGVLGTMSRVSAFNPVSIRSHSRMGARKLGSQTYVCCGRAQLLISTLSPFFHISFSDARRPKAQIRFPAYKGRVEQAP